MARNRVSVMMMTGDLVLVLVMMITDNNNDSNDNG